MMNTFLQCKMIHSKSWNYLTKIENYEKYRINSRKNGLQPICRPPPSSLLHHYHILTPTARVTQHQTRDFFTATLPRDMTNRRYCSVLYRNQLAASRYCARVHVRKLILADSINFAWSIGDQVRRFFGEKNFGFPKSRSISTLFSADFIDARLIDYLWLRLA